MRLRTSVSTPSGRTLAKSCSVPTTPAIPSSCNGFPSCEASVQATSCEGLGTSSTNLIRGLTTGLLMLDCTDTLEELVVGFCFPALFPYSR